MKKEEKQKTIKRNLKILSIVIPTYNVEKYLERCLNSIVFDKNILNDIEVIIVNDGSKDNSLEIAKRYEKQYPDSIIVIDKLNGGHGSTINAGLNVASGKYFRVIDSDDWVNIDDFSKYVLNLKKCDEDVILTDFSREFIYTGESVKFTYTGIDYDKHYDLTKFDFQKLGTDYFFMATSSFKLEKLKKADFLLDEKTFYVDMEFILLPMLELKSMRYLNYDIYRYFIGRPEQSVNLQSFVRNRKHHEKVLKRLLAFYKGIDSKSNKKQYVFRIIVQMLNTHYVIYCKAQLNNKRDKKEIIEFDRYLKENYTDIYNEIKKRYAYIKANQKTNFKFCQTYNNLFSKLVERREGRK